MLYYQVFPLCLLLLALWFKGSNIGCFDIYNYFKFCWIDSFINVFISCYRCSFKVYCLIYALLLLFGLLAKIKWYMYSYSFFCLHLYGISFSILSLSLFVFLGIIGVSCRQQISRSFFFSQYGNLKILNLIILFITCSKF